MPAGAGGERKRVPHLTDDDMLHDRYKYYNVTYVLSDSGLPTQPKYQLVQELKAMHSWLKDDVYLYCTPGAADQFVDMLKYFNKAPPDLQRTQDQYRADFCAWNEQHAVYPNSLVRSMHPRAEAPNSDCRQGNHCADVPSAVSGNGAQQGTRNGDHVETSQATAVTDLPGALESAPTRQEHIGEAAKRLNEHLSQLVASEADVKIQLADLDVSNQVKQQALKDRKRQLAEEQEKLEKDYVVQKERLEREVAALQGRKEQIALQLTELKAAQPQAQQVHNEDDSFRQANSIARGGAEASRDNVAHRDAVSIASDSDEDVPLKHRKKRVISSDDDCPLESNRRGPPATCSATNSQFTKSPSTAFHAPSPKKPRGMKGESYAAKRFAERVPDNRASSEFFNKLGLDKYTVLSRARDMRADIRKEGVQWRMDLYWTYNPSAPGAERFKEGEYAGSEANWEVMLIQKGVLQLKDLPEANHKEEYYSVGKKSLKKDVKDFQEVRSKYASALGVSAFKPREQKNKYKDIPRAEITPPEP